MSEESNLGKEDELIGGLNNAINHGETLNAAAMTFVNAGYSPQLVSLAVRKMMNSSTVSEFNVPTQKMVNIPSSNLNLYAQRSSSSISNPFPNNNHEPVNNFRPQKQQQYSKPLVPYWAIVLMLLLSLGIIVGAGVLGLYWDKIF